MPAVERHTPPIFGGNDPLDYRQVALAERIVLIAKETLPPAIGLLGIDPTLHDMTADEGGHFFGAVPRVKQQSVVVVRSLVDRQPGERHVSFLPLVPALAWDVPFDIRSCALSGEGLERDIP